MRISLATARKISQILFFALFLILFFLWVYPFPLKWPVRLLLQSDPLMAVISMFAAKTFIASMTLGLVVLGLTLIFGRFFCGYICPLGTLIDFVGHFGIGKKGVKESKEPKPGRRVKYLILAGVLLAALLGADLLHFFSPLAITPRFFAILVFPPITWLLDAGFSFLAPAFSKAGFDNLALFSWNRYFFYGALPTLLLMAGIFIALYWRKRFWCRYVCPAGALLGLASRVSLLRRTVNKEVCNDCGRCASVCDMRAIGEDFGKTVPGECTLCGNCSDACNKNANKIGFAGIGPLRDGDGASRRAFLVSAGAGVVAASALKNSPEQKHALQGTLIRPPGALPEAEFLSRCARCGACLKACKTNGLQPCDLELGWDKLWTPRLMPRIGGCEEKCNVCGYVCPTQAIRALPLEEKRFVKIGTAVIDRERCIVWEQDRLCLICDEICPYDAIEFRPVENAGTKINRPVVIEDKCTGCGLCETKCPISGRSAIEIYSIGEERKRSGSYITEEKKRLRAQIDAPESGAGTPEDVPEGFSR